MPHSHMAKEMIRRRGAADRKGIIQAAFKGIQRAIEEVEERDVPITHVDPRNASRLCPVMGRESPTRARIGKCSAGALSLSGTSAGVRWSDVEFLVIGIKII